MKWGVLFIIILLMDSLVALSLCDFIPTITQQTARYPYVVNGVSYRIHPLLVLAVITQESGGNPQAVSPVGARGLMQIMPQTAELLGCKKEKLADPEENIRCGVQFFAALLTYTKGDLVKALSGYNAGSHSTEKSPLLGGRIADNPETRTYVKRVLGYFESYKKNHPCKS